jgi:hypothetical protein
MTEQPPLAAVDPAADAAAPARRSTRARVAMSLVLLLVAGLLATLAWDDVRLHRETAQQARRADDLGGQIAVLRARSDRLGAQVTSLQAQNGLLPAEARAPTLEMWDACAGPCTIGPEAVRVGSVPDTFQLLITFTADVPVRTYVFTFHQWTQFDGCAFNVRCVTGAYTAFDPARSLDTTFADAEGCSGYVWVLRADSAGTITPNVRVRYLPADHPTGVCAGGS